MCAFFGTGDIEPFSDLSSKFSNEFRQQILDGKDISFSLLLVSDVSVCAAAVVVAFVNTILCFQHTFYPWHDKSELNAVRVRVLPCQCQVNMFNFIAHK